MISVRFESPPTLTLEDGGTCGFVSNDDFFVVTFPPPKKAACFHNKLSEKRHNLHKSKSTICAMMTFVWVDSVFHSHVCKLCATLRLPAASPIIAATRWDACRPRQHSAMDIGCLEIFWVVMGCGSIWDDANVLTS